MYRCMYIYIYISAHIYIRTYIHKGDSAPVCVTRGSRRSEGLGRLLGDLGGHRGCSRSRRVALASNHRRVRSAGFQKLLGCSGDL